MRNDELMHYGVLGMKWGHRKQRPRRSDEERVARRRKIAKGLGAAAGVAGASAGAYYLYKHGKRIKKVPKKYNVVKAPKIKTGKDYLKKHHGAVRGPNVKSSKMKDDQFTMRERAVNFGFYDLPEVKLKTGKDPIKTLPPIWDKYGKKGRAQKRYVRRQGVEPVDYYTMSDWKRDLPIPNVKVNRRKRR